MSNLALQDLGSFRKCSNETHIHPMTFIYTILICMYIYIYTIMYKCTYIYIYNMYVYIHSHYEWIQIQTTLRSFPIHGGYPHRALGRALAIAPDLHFVAHAVDLRSLMNLWEIHGKSMGNLWENLWEIYGKSMGNLC